MEPVQAYFELERTLKEWTKTPHGRRTFIACVPLLLTACASPGKTRYREGDNSGQATSLSVKDEIQMTKEYLPQMRKEYPILKDASLQNYLDQVGQNIVRRSGHDGRPYRYSFTLVEADHVNAFALPAGTVFVTAPLLAMAESEAELAGVIGHEVGHIKARHTAERLDHAKKQQGKSWLYGLGGGLLGAGAGHGLGKLLCRKNDKKCQQKALMYGTAAGVGGGLLIQKFAFMANSREDEMEADRIGFRTAVATNYHKDHVGRFYSKLLKMEEKASRGGGLLKSFADAMSTHPPSKERVNQMNLMANRQPRQKSPIVSTKAFENTQKKLKRFIKS